MGHLLTHRLDRPRDGRHDRAAGAARRGVVPDHGRRRDARRSPRRSRPTGSCRRATSALGGTGWGAERLGRRRRLEPCGSVRRRPGVPARHAPRLDDSRPMFFSSLGPADPIQSRRVRERRTRRRRSPAADIVGSFPGGGGGCCRCGRHVPVPQDRPGPVRAHRRSGPRRRLGRASSRSESPTSRSSPMRCEPAPSCAATSASRGTSSGRTTGWPWRSCRSTTTSLRSSAPGTRASCASATPSSASWPGSRASR